MNRRLKLAVLAQAILDAIDQNDEQQLETALMHLSAYPGLVARLSRSDEDLSKWRARVEKALGRPPEPRS